MTLARRKHDALTIALGALLAFALAAIFAGCGKVVRDATVYRNEVAFFSAAAGQTAEVAARRLREVCPCALGADGALRLGDDACRADAHKVLAARTMAGYFGDWMLYNAGLSKARPAKEPPPVPPVETLCKDVTP